MFIMNSFSNMLMQLQACYICLKICAFLHQGVLIEHLLCAGCYPRCQAKAVNKRHKRLYLSELASQWRLWWYEALCLMLSED